MMKNNHFDVLIIGAGLSGIGAACHLVRECPKKSFAVLERREAIGGTWDLFRYPGIRSDSDMYSFGYSFRPWTEPRVLADGPSIRRYVNETAQEYGVDKHIRFGRKVLSADWSSALGVWTVEALDEQTGKAERYTAGFVIGCTGYYNYDAGYRPDFPGEKDFKGQIVHPQHWPETLDYKGKRVVVIGSGATAITLVPSMADTAEHVTMLQRSPTYILTVPAVDPIARNLQRLLPSKLAYRLNRGRNIAINRLLYRMARARPKVVKRLLLGLVRKQLGGTIDMRHFTPHYNPWDERLCVVPNGDLFKALRSGRASMATDHIERFTKTGIQLKSGEHLDADIIVTATGLDVQMLGGVKMAVDGEPVQINQLLTYKGVLVEGIPNAAIVFGYTNISWTLKADIASEYVCRLLKHMDRKGYTRVVPRDHGDNLTDDTVLGALSSGYIRRSADRLPRQGREMPWQVRQDYVRDAPMLRFGDIEDGCLEFVRGSAAPVATAPPARAAAG
ncbi:NAD(P)/FAD-dependent oxidoreductase [Flagellatimonas centrodinii]|nr:NAD(P)/FAD-dependent oxidoreductase [Flagellatimonas centrodinii]ULQ47645.1 NAD(P)/FAD-dependent oxidoreductase [Flagellatimonas centrodinii]